MKPVLVFDMNETLLDMSALDPAFAGIFGQAGIRQQFDAVLSADAVERYKPAREAYEYAAKELDVKPGRIVLVAAHAWDVSGAMAARCEAAFIARPEKVMSPGAPPPRYEAADVAALAEELVSNHG